MFEHFSDHEWFKKDLPSYLFPPISEQEASIVDMEAVKELCDVNSDRDFVRFFSFSVDFCRNSAVKKKT